MNEFRIRADSFVLKNRRKRIYRVRHHRGATVFWTSPDDALKYLRDFQARRLQAKDKRR
jgi:hypothetical protein